MFNGYFSNFSYATVDSDTFMYNFGPLFCDGGLTDIKSFYL